MSSQTNPLSEMIETACEAAIKRAMKDQPCPTETAANYQRSCGIPHPVRTRDLQHDRESAASGRKARKTAYDRHS